MTITQPAQEMVRDRLGRPMVLPTTGTGKRMAYSRCTTFVDATEDTYNLSRWSQRMVAIGLAKRRDYLLAVSVAAPDAETSEGKQKLNDLCEQAIEVAKDNKATIGTALHALTERIDLGLSVDDVPLEFVPDLAAYQQATAGLKMLHVEHGVVLDTLKIHGTPDRVFEYQGKRYIGDVKTGNLDFGVGKIARQLAVYARSALYDDKTGTRTPHGADTKRGLIIHLPAGTGTCNLIWVDLLAGWDGVQLCATVREHRSFMSARRITLAGLDNDAPFPAQATTLDPMPIDNLLSAINGATSRAQLVELWRQHKPKFRPHHIEAARIRGHELDTQQIPAGNPPAGSRETEGVTA